MFIYSTQERLHPTFSVHNIILIPPFLSLNISHYKTTHGVISTNPQKTIFTRKSSLLVVNVRHIIQCTCPPIMTEILNSPKNNLNQLTDGGCKKWREMEWNHIIIIKSCIEAHNFLQPQPDPSCFLFSALCKPHSIWYFENCSFRYLIQIISWGVLISSSCRPGHLWPHLEDMHEAHIFLQVCPISTKSKKNSTPVGHQYHAWGSLMKEMHVLLNLGSAYTWWDPLKTV